MKRWLGFALLFGCLLVALGCKKEKPVVEDDGDRQPDKPRPDTEKLRAQAQDCVLALHQLMLANANYKDTNGKQCFDSNIVLAKGWSWRIELLPYIEQDIVYKVHFATLAPNLNERFFDANGKPAKGQEKADERFKQIAEGAPIKLYMIGDTKDQRGMTPYHRVVSKNKPGAFIVVETTKQTPWTLPGDDLVLDPEKKLPEMGGNFPPGIIALCGDGRVRLIDRGMKKKDLIKALEDGTGVKALPTDPEKLKKVLEKEPWDQGTR